MATGIEQGLLLFARIAAGGVLLVFFGFITYGVGGYLFLVEAAELSYPFLDVDQDPVLNFLLAIIGVGMFVTSLPLLLLSTVFSQDKTDIIQVLLTTILGAVGLALVRLSVLDIL